MLISYSLSAADSALFCWVAIEEERGVKRRRAGKESCEVAKSIAYKGFPQVFTQKGASSQRNDQIPFPSSTPSLRKSLLCQVAIFAEAGL